MSVLNLFERASKSYHQSPTALHRRAMNVLYGTLEEKDALMLTPRNGAASMGMNGMLTAANVQSRLTRGEDT